MNLVFPLPQDDLSILLTSLSDAGKEMRHSGTQYAWAEDGRMVLSGDPPPLYISDYLIVSGHVTRASGLSVMDIDHPSAAHHPINQGE